MKKSEPFFLNRNFILVTAMILGIFAGEFANSIKHFSLPVLGLVMIFSLTEINIKDLLPLRDSIKVMMESLLFVWIVSSILIISLSAFLISNDQLYFGMVVIASSPPGIAVIPFSVILEGDLKYSLLGTFGSYLGSVIITPLIIYFFSGGKISMIQLLIVMIEIIIIPFILSRLLLAGKINVLAGKIRGKVIDFGFAVIIYIAVGLNRQVFFSASTSLIKISCILVCATFVTGFLFDKIAKKRKHKKKSLISKKLLMTVKSSGFTAATSLTLFGKEAAAPSAILSVVILGYLLVQVFVSEKASKQVI